MTSYSAKYLYAKKLLSTFLLLILFPLCSEADTVVLKNGMKFNSEKIWEENGEVKCYLNSLVVGFPREEVERIDKATSKSVDTSTAIDPEKIKYDLVSSKKNLDQKQRLLNLEYQTLLQEAKQLEAMEKQLKSKADRHAFAERILEYNRKVEQYENKRKTFDIEVKAYQRQVEKENTLLLIDEDTFSKVIGTWVSYPIDNFIGKWGYPDKIIHMPSGNRRYVFVVEITPVLTRQITFNTNPSGIIVDFAVEAAALSQENDEK